MLNIIIFYIKITFFYRKIMVFYRKIIILYRKDTDWKFRLSFILQYWVILEDIIKLKIPQTQHYTNEEYSTKL